MMYCIRTNLLKDCGLFEMNTEKEMIHGFRKYDKIQICDFYPKNKVLKLLKCFKELY